VRLIVPAEAAGERLDRFLASLPEVGSRAAAERLIEDGAALVDGVTRPKSNRLVGGEELAVQLPEGCAPEMEPEQLPLRSAW